MRYLLVCVVAGFVFALSGFATTAQASPVPSCPIDDYGNCLPDWTADYTIAYDTLDTGQDTVEYYGGGYNCKVVHAIRTFRNYVGVILLQYVEQVRFCYNGSTVTEFTRWRWPQNMTWGLWTFDQNIGSSCLSEYCQEQTGGWWEHAQTQGQFHASVCLPILGCLTRDPWVDIGVDAAGRWGANTGG